MPWIDVSEPYAKEPRLRSVKPSRSWQLDRDTPLALDRGWAELADTELTVGPASTSDWLDVERCAELSIVDSRLNGARLSGQTPSVPPADQLALELARSELHDCDLSRTRIRSINRCRIRGAKLTGTDLSAGSLTDVAFERCSFTMANLRMAKLTRVRFEDCLLDDIDGYQLQANDVSLPGTTAQGLNLDGLRAERFDLREATELSFSVVNSLAGCLVDEHQLAGMAHALAFAAGVAIARPTETDDR